MSATMSAPPPAAGAMPPPGDDDAAGMADTDDNVVCTVCKDGQGGFIVYAGDEPEGDTEADMSEDDAAAMGPTGDMAASSAPEGRPADSVGAALKIVMDIMQADASGEGGDAESQFSGGFTGSQAPTPTGMGAQKY